MVVLATKSTKPHQNPGILDLVDDSSWRSRRVVGFPGEARDELLVSLLGFVDDRSTGFAKVGA